MLPKQTNAIFAGVFGFLLLLAPLSRADKKYDAKSQDEIDLFAAVIGAEIEANHWSKEQKICISVDTMNPTKKLVEALKQQQLNVCSSSELTKDLPCSFQVSLHSPVMDASGTARVQSDVGDFHEPHAPTAYLGIVLRSGEYTLAKVSGKWTIKAYSKSK